MSIDFQCKTLNFNEKSGSFPKLFTSKKYKYWKLQKSTIFLNSKLCLAMESFTFLSQPYYLHQVCNSRESQTGRGREKISVHTWCTNSDLCNTACIKGTRWTVLLASVRKPKMVIFRVNWLTLVILINYFNKYGYAYNSQIKYILRCYMQ